MEYVIVSLSGTWQQLQSLTWQATKWHYVGAHCVPQRKRGKLKNEDRGVYDACQYVMASGVVCCPVNERHTAGKKIHGKSRSTVAVRRSACLTYVIVPYNFSAFFFLALLRVPRSSVWKAMVVTKKEANG